MKSLDIYAALITGLLLILIYIHTQHYHKTYKSDYKTYKPDYKTYKPDKKIDDKQTCNCEKHLQPKLPPVDVQEKPKQCISRRDILQDRMQALEPNMYDSFRIGILQQPSRLLELWAVPRDRRRNRFCYKARDPETHMSFQVVFLGNVCHIDNCCTEIADGAAVNVKGFSGTFTAIIDPQNERLLWT